MMTSVQAAPRRISPWLVLALISIPVFVGSLDLTIVSAFLPEIIIRLQLPVETIVNDAAWVVTGYLVAYTASMLFMGRASDLIGRRRAYLICIALFMLGSLMIADVDPEARRGFSGWLYSTAFRLTGARPDPGSIALLAIIIGRVVQALGAGAVVPVSLALVGDLFPRERRARPLGVVGAIDTSGWMLGHLYGGMMVALFSTNSAAFVSLIDGLGLNWPAPDWRTLFWINVPVSALGLVLTLWALRGAQQTRARGRFDLLGGLLVVGALVSLVVGLGANIEISATLSTFSQTGGLPPYAGPLLALAGILFAAFLIVETRLRDPLYDLRAFRRRGIAMGSLTNIAVGFSLMIGLVSVPILINIRIADATELADAALQVGILLSALTVPMALAAAGGGWLSDRIGPARAAGLGMALAAIGFLSIATTWTVEVANGLIAVQMALVGLGFGLTFSPVSAAMLNAADSDKLGAASALVIIMRMLGMTVGVALLTALASSRLTQLAAAELGQAALDPFAAIETYMRLTVQVLTEIALLGAAICAIGVIPALRLRDRQPVAPAVPQAGGASSAEAKL
ncbi:MAG: MFS transporter [Aggregatilineales bacterium]